MRVLFWGLIGLSSILSVIYISTVIVFNYNYDRTYGQYLKLSDDASTADTKLGYLKQYREAVSSIDREQGAYVFQQKQYTKTEQLKILDSLIVRLEDSTKMDPKSFEYQQAMYQISGQEMNHSLERIDGIFEDCYFRTTPSNIICINFVPWLVCIFIIVCMIISSNLY